MCNRNARLSLPRVIAADSAGIFDAIRKLHHQRQLKMRCLSILMRPHHHARPPPISILSLGRSLQPLQSDPILNWPATARTQHRRNSVTSNNFDSALLNVFPVKERLCRTHDHLATSERSLTNLGQLQQEALAPLTQLGITALAALPIWCVHSSGLLIRTCPKERKGHCGCLGDCVPPSVWPQSLNFGSL